MKYIIAILLVSVSLSCFGQEVDMVQLNSIAAESYQTNSLNVETNNKGITVKVPAGQDGSIVFHPENTYWDLTEHVFLSLELENKTKNQLRFDPVILYDNPKRGKKIRAVKNKHIGFLHPQENLVFNCVLIRDKINSADYPQVPDFPVMKGLPDGLILNFDGIDAKHIKGLKIDFPKADFERKVLIKRIFKNKPALPELYATNKNDFFPFIDRYGQYKHRTWEGKITDDKHFETAKSQEKAALKKHTGSPEWNRFGGLANGPSYKATGNFRTQKIDGKWWLIDPEGKLFWSVGVNGAGKLVVNTPYKKREHFFETDFKNLGKNSKFKQKNSYNFGTQNLYIKYGKNAEEDYMGVTLDRMKSWGINTLGGWSNEAVATQPEAKKLPYTIYINAMYPSINEKFPDVFDPKWKADVEKKVKQKAAFAKDDPYFFGFFINNEIHWGTPYSLALNNLEKEGNSVGKKVYIDLLKEKLKTIENFNELTGGQFKSWQALLNAKVKKKDLKLTAIKDINELHYRNMTEQYFKITREAIDTYAPGKMYIGCRWHGNHKNKINVAIGAKYLDVLSFNAYENEIEFYPYPQKELDKPFIVSEFNFGALDVGKFFTGLGYASSQRNRGEKYQNFITGALRSPRCVGAHWFMWADSTTAGRGNGENANCGLVSQTDQIYYELTDYMRTKNYQIYKERLSNK